MARHLDGLRFVHCGINIPARPGSPRYDAMPRPGSVYDSFGVNDDPSLEHRPPHYAKRIVLAPPAPNREQAANYDVMRHRLRAVAARWPTAEKAIEEFALLSPEGSAPDAIARAWLFSMMRLCIAAPSLRGERARDAANEVLLAAGLHESSAWYLSCLTELLRQQGTPNISSPEPLTCLLVGTTSRDRNRAARGIAEAFNRPLYVIDMAEVKDCACLWGIHSSLDSAGPGAIARGIMATGHPSPLYLFDNIDQMSNQAAMALRYIYNQTREHGEGFSDEYLGFNLDLRQAHFLFGTSRLDAPEDPGLYSRIGHDPLFVGSASAPISSEVSATLPADVQTESLAPQPSRGRWMQLVDSLGGWLHQMWSWLLRALGR